MKHADVPFVENPDDRCLVATTAMVLAYFAPEKSMSMPEMERLCGYEKGKATWPAESMLNMSNLGFRLHWIENFDTQKFVAEPRAYLRTILDDEAYEWQVSHSDIEAEAKRIEQYSKSGMPIENRKATKDDIIRFLDDGWLLRLEVNAQTLVGKPGYDGHSILALGYDADSVIIHNPDGRNGNVPNQRITWELLEKARQEFGNVYSLYAFKK